MATSPSATRAQNDPNRNCGRILTVPAKSAACGRPSRSWKAPSTRSLERLRYVAHADVLVDGIEVRLKNRRNADGTETVIESPQSFADYQIINQWETKPLPKGVNLHLRHENPVRRIPASS